MYYIITVLWYLCITMMMLWCWASSPLTNNHATNTRSLIIVLTEINIMITYLSIYARPNTQSGKWHVSFQPSQKAPLLVSLKSGWELCHQQSVTFWSANSLNFNRILRWWRWARSDSGGAAHEKLRSIQFERRLKRDSSQRRRKAPTHYYDPLMSRAKKWIRHPTNWTSQ